MPQSIGERPGMNNPGNLTVGSAPSHRILYAGQTGVYNSPNGLAFAQFGTPQQGVQALLDYIRRNGVGKTIRQFVERYLGNANLAPSALNRDPHGYAANIANAIGGNLDTPITSANISNVARGIMQGEGTLDTFGSFLGRE